MSDETFETEIRIYLIGHNSVGKKSIVKRFKTLTSSKTNEHFDEEEEKKEKKKLKKEKKKENENEEENNENQLNTIKKKEEEPKILSYEEKVILKNEQKRHSLMKFSKEYIFGKNTISLHFYPCLEATSVSYDFEPKEDDEEYDLIKTYKITLKTLKQEIQYYFNLPPMKKNCNIDHLFFFVFDLKDFSSFEKLCVYFEELNKKFLITSNFKNVLIGNKVDQKKNFSDEEKEIFESFVSKYNLKYYEISTLSFFHFEKFFINLFKEDFNQITNSNIENKLQDLLSKKSNFSKAEKGLTRVDSNPGPDKYNSNVYDLPKNREEMKKTFSGEKRFNKHIFINKIGPLFPLIKKDYDKDFSHSLKKQNKTSYNQINTWNSNIRKEIKDSLELNCDIPGFTLGAKASNLDLRQTRKDLKFQMNKLLDDAFSENNIRFLNKSPPKFKDNKLFEKYALIRKENFQNRIDEMKKQEEYYKELHDDVIKKNENNRKNLLDKIKEKEQKYNTIYQQKEFEKEKNRTFYQNKTSGSRLIKEKITPTMYDIRGKFDTKKGFTFGGKFKFNENKNKSDPPFNTIYSDFEKIILKSKKIKYPNQTYAERFYTPKIDQPGDPSKIFEKLNKYQLNKIKYLKDNESKFFKQRKMKKNAVLMNKKRIEEEREKDLEMEIERQIALTGENFLLRDINYTLVEDSSPSYTMKGKYEDNKFKFREYENEDNINYLNNLIHPNIAVVRPSLPKYSFGKSERFEDLKMKDKDKNNKNKNNNIDYIENNYFDYDNGFNSKTIDTSLQNYMGTARKDTILKDNGVPGPGYYWIKGFADIVKEKGEKINEVRTRIREKEMRSNDLGNNNNIEIKKKNVIDDEDNYYNENNVEKENNNNNENIDENKNEESKKDNNVNIESENKIEDNNNDNIEKFNSDNENVQNENLNNENIIKSENDGNNNLNNEQHIDDNNIDNKNDEKNIVENTHVDTNQEENKNVETTHVENTNVESNQNIENNNVESNQVNVNNNENNEGDNNQNKEGENGKKE